MKYLAPLIFLGFTIFGSHPVFGAFANVDITTATGSTATQSSTHPAGPPDSAIDGSLGNFTHTNPPESPAGNAWWEADLGSDRTIQRVRLYNRGDGCCQYRLRDISVTVKDSTGAVLYTVTGINPGNALGGPAFINVDLPAEVTTARFIRVERTPQPGLEGDHDGATLSLGEVKAYVVAPLPPWSDLTYSVPEMTVSQSTTLGGYAASLAVNGSAGDFTHTDGSDANPSWTVNFGEMLNLQGFEILNRGDGCCQDRLRDITVTVKDDSNVVVFTSALLNPGNTLGGPPRLRGVYPLGLAGQSVTITRTASPGGEGVLSLGEVRILGYGAPVTIPAVGCGTNLTHVSFPTRLATQSSEYGAFPAGNAMNGNYYDGGDFTHTAAGDPNPTWAVDFGALVNPERLTIFNRYGCCPERLSDVTVRLMDGNGDVIWTSPLLNPGNVLGGPATIALTIPLGLPPVRIVAISLPGGGLLSMAEVDIFGSTIVPPAIPSVAAGSNLTHVGFPTMCVTQSTGSGYPAGNAVDGDYFGNFTHTDGGDTKASWEVDFGSLVKLEHMTIFNRYACCEYRLRDITVRVLDGDGVVVWTSPLLNPENVLNGPATLTVFFPLGLSARIVSISRTPDPDGSGGLGGNNDDGNVLSMAEVDIYGSTAAPPAVPSLAAGSNLTHVSFPGRSVAQSSEWPGFPAGNAVNASLGDFTHTNGVDNNSNWSVDFGASVSLESFTLHNRGDCCQQRLRDITVSVFDENGIEVYNSGLLNPENILAGPSSLSGTFPPGLHGRIVLVSRAPDPDSSGGEGPNVLSLGEVDIFGSTSTDLYQTWIADYYTGSDALTTADPEHDGVMNLVEYAFQLDPTSSALGTISYDGGVLTGLGLPTISPANEWPLRAIFGRRMDYVAAGLTYTVEFSANLVDWEPSLEIPDFIATDGEIMDVVSVPFPADPPEGPLDILYFRVRITK